MKKFALIRAKEASKQNAEAAAKAVKPKAVKVTKDLPKFHSASVVKLEPLPVISDFSEPDMEVDLREDLTVPELGIEPDVDPDGPTSKSADFSVSKGVEYIENTPKEYLLDFLSPDETRKGIKKAHKKKMKHG